MALGPVEGGEQDRTVGASSSSGTSRSVATRTAAAAASAATVPRTTQAPRGPRRTHSAAHEIAWASAVATSSQSSTGTCAASSPVGPTTKAVAPSTT